MAELGAAEHRRVGVMLAAATAALEEVLGAERVYTLSFCEVDRRLHFHIFPRTRELLAAYQHDTGTEAEEVDGPRLFEWTRAACPAGRTPPWAAGAPDPSASLRDFLRRF